MSKIDEMIRELCPEGIMYKSLGELADEGFLTLGRGQIISKIDMRDTPGEYPVYSSSSQNNGEIGRYGKYMFDDERITWSIDGGGILFYRNNLKYSVTNVCGWLKVSASDVLDTKFLYYTMYQQWTNIEFNYTHKAHPSVIRDEYKIPFPPLSIQQKIVSVLDSFTTLIDKMKQEVEKRKKQMEYYREKLLTFEDGECEWKTLGDISTDIYSGATPSTKIKEYWENGNIPWMSSGEVHQGQVNNVEGKITELGYSRCSTKMVPINSVVIALAGQGKTRGTVAITRIELCTNQSLAAIVPNTDIVDSDYLYYYLRGEYMNLRTVSSGDGTRGGLNLRMLYEYSIPVINLKRQREIVSILDKFESYISKLERMITLRQKQYEYYREKLLTFE